MSNDKTNVEILVSFAQFEVGDTRLFSHSVAQGLIKGGYAKEIEHKGSNLEILSLKELRVLYPEIKANSVEKFLSQINA
jgi:hypothetical protein